jgi:hypothetical protein
MGARLLSVLPNIVSKVLGFVPNIDYLCAVLTFKARSVGGNEFFDTPGL